MEKLVNVPVLLR